MNRYDQLEPGSAYPALGFSESVTRGEGTPTPSIA